MTLQSSGAISFSDLETEYVGSPPNLTNLGINRYYRNGSFVPNSIIEYEPGPGTGNFSYSRTGTTYYWQDSYWGFGATRGVFWASTEVVDNPGFGTTSVTVGEWTYTRGTQQSAESQGTTVINGVTHNHTFNFFNLRRERTVLVNQNVPTSGQISMSNFYGGRKT